MSNAVTDDISAARERLDEAKHANDLARVRLSDAKAAERAASDAYTHTQQGVARARQALRLAEIERAVEQQPELYDTCEGCNGTGQYRHAPQHDIACASCGGAGVQFVGKSRTKRQRP